MNALLLSCALLAASTGISSEVMEVSGSVTIERGAKDVQAKIGMMLETGDKVITAKDGHIAFMMPGNALVSLGSDTSLVIDESKENKEGFASTINLLKGRMRSLVGGIFGRKVAFNTKTPNAVAGVRGTYIMAEVGDSGAESFFTINGQQEITHKNGDTIMLGAGQGIAIMPTGFGSQLSLNSDIINNMQADTKIPINLPTNIATSTVNNKIANPSEAAAAAAAGSVISNGITNDNTTINTGDYLPPGTPASTLDIHVILE